MQSNRLCILEILLLVRIFRVCKSDKIILEVLSGKCECLDSNQRRDEYREVVSSSSFQWSGLIWVKAEQKEVFFPFPPLHSVSDKT